MYAPTLSVAPAPKLEPDVLREKKMQQLIEELHILGVDAEDMTIGAMINLANEVAARESTPEVNRVRLRMRVADMHEAMRA